MAGYRKRNGKWEVRIRRNNSKNLSKTFINKEPGSIEVFSFI